MKAQPRKKPAAAKTAKKTASRSVRSIDKSCLPAGSLTVTVTRFRSLGAVTELQAEVTNWSGFATPRGVPMPQPPPTLTVTDSNIVVCSEYPVQLIFNLPDPNYILVGAAWDEALLNSVGETTFPEVLVRRNVTIPVPYQPAVPGGSCLIVTDNAADTCAYDYVLMIQSTTTGEIGFFDPGIDNKPQH